MKPLDISGQKFERLTALYSKSMKDTSGKNRKYWCCKCDCGSFVLARSSDLRSGRKKSCGCLHRELLIKRNEKHNKANTRLYHVWISMKERCFNSNNVSYANYGGRGITVCNEWLNFDSFYEWAMDNGYAVEISSSNRNKLSLDRIDNDGNYEPSNCRWVDNITQSYNKRDNYKICYNGKLMTIKDLAAISGFQKRTIYARLNNGWTVKDAITIKPSFSNNKSLRSRRIPNEIERTEYTSIRVKSSD